ncbi:hypothetical protein L1887_31768 [Cichorium endivia]|nr:hypothetical protein L1887_31768 [Cichorium endivia]
MSSQAYVDDHLMCNIVGNGFFLIFFCISNDFFVKQNQPHKALIFHAPLRIVCHSKESPPYSPVVAFKWYVDSEKNEEWVVAKIQEAEALKKKNAANRKLIFNRTKQYREKQKPLEKDAGEKTITWLDKINNSNGSLSRTRETLEEEMAEVAKGGQLIPESVLKKQKRNKEWVVAKIQEPNL